MRYFHSAQIEEIVRLAEELRGGRGGRALEKGDIVATDAVEDGPPPGCQLHRAEIRLEQFGKRFVAKLALISGRGRHETSDLIETGRPQAGRVTGGSSRAPG